jgi:hypothetical protein
MRQVMHMNEIARKRRLAGTSYAVGCILSGTVFAYATIAKLDEHHPVAFISAMAILIHLIAAVPVWTWLLGTEEAADTAAQRPLAQPAAIPDAED